MAKNACFACVTRVLRVLRVLRALRALRVALRVFAARKVLRTVVSTRLLLIFTWNVYFQRSEIGGLSPFNSSVHHGIGRLGIRISYEKCYFQRLKWVVNVSKRALWLKDEVLRSTVCDSFSPERSVLLVAFGGSESIQFERPPRDRTLRRRQITRNMQFSKFKMRATWIDRLHFNLQKLDNSVNFGGAWEPVSVVQARIEWTLKKMKKKIREVKIF